MTDQLVTLHVTHAADEEFPQLLRITGEVKRGGEVLHAQSTLCENDIQTVPDVKEDVALEIELWAVKNTDYTPSAETESA